MFPGPGPGGSELWLVQDNGVWIGTIVLFLLLRKYRSKGLVKNVKSDGPGKRDCGYRIKFDVFRTDASL